MIESKYDNDKVPILTMWNEKNVFADLKLMLGELKMHCPIYSHFWKLGQNFSFLNTTPVALPPLAAI